MNSNMHQLVIIVLFAAIFRTFLLSVHIAQYGICIHAPLQCTILVFRLIHGQYLSAG